MVPLFQSKTCANQVSENLWEEIRCVALTQVVMAKGLLETKGKGK